MLSITRGARRFGFGLAAAILLGGLAAKADGIPPTALEADQRSCIAACVEGGKDPGKCGGFCSCSAKAYGEQLTIEEYLAINNAISKGEAPPQEALDKMKAISSSCRSHLDAN